MLESEYGGAVPSDMDSLLKLPGVGRKTAKCYKRKYIRRAKHSRGYACKESVEKTWTY